MSKAKRAALIGYDCLIPKRLEVMLAQGGLDNFRKFMAEGSFIPEGYNLPTVTPPSWATICTGAYPRTHGVEDYYYYHEGRSLDYKETSQAFGSDILTAETIWDAWDKEGKKCVVVNYPMSWPSKMKNGVLVMGQGLSPAETRWPLHGNEHKEFLASESVIFSTFGISFASLSASAYGTRRTRATSRTTAFALPISCSESSPFFIPLFICLSAIVTANPLEKRTGLPQSEI